MKKNQILIAHQSEGIGWTKKVWLEVTPSLLPILLNSVILLHIDPYSTVPNNLKDGVPPQGLSDRLTCEAHKAKFVNIVMD